MKIAFVRGPHLNPWELQSYAPLARHHAFATIGANWQFYKGTFDHNIPIQKASVWGARLGRLHRGLFVYYNRTLSWTLGRSYGFYNLDSYVKDADILHSAETFSTMTHQCLEIRRRHPCKVVVTVWENLPHMGETHPLRLARKRKALKELDGFLAVTETSRRTLVQEGAPAERTEVIPMAVDLAHFKPAPRDQALSARWGLKPDEKIVLFIGRWVAEKGVAEILHAIPKVLKQVSVAIRFCFVGSGPLEGLLQKARQDYPGRIELVPFVPYNQLPTLHNMADVFILPSKPAPKWQEQFGYVLVESMACGKAIVTTRSGSILDVVGDAAWLVNPGDASELANSLIRLLHSAQERARLGEAAHLRAIERFDAEKIARRIEAFYQRVLKRSS